MDTNVLIEFVKQKLEGKTGLTNTQLKLLGKVIDGKPTEIIVIENNNEKELEDNRESERTNNGRTIDNQISAICEIISEQIYSNSDLKKDLIKKTSDRNYRVARKNVKYILEELFKEEDSKNSKNSPTSLINRNRGLWKDIIRQRAENLDVFNLPQSKTDSNFFIERKLKVLGSQEEPKVVNEIIKSSIEDKKSPFKAFIYGGSGLGKTSLLKRIALDYIKDDKEDYFPILISLRRFSAQEQDLYTYISELFARVEVFQPELRKVLQTEKVLILFDCLSGGQEENRNTLVQLEKFVREFNKCSYIITSNVQSYYIEGFEQYELTYFEQRNIDYFIGQWFRNKCGDNINEARNLSEKLKKIIKNLRTGEYEDLPGIPFYLSLFCQVFSQEQNINSYIHNLTPKSQKIFLFTRAISSLLIWDDTRQIETSYYKDLIEEKRAFDLFSFLAFEILLDRKTSNGYVKKERIQELIKNFILSYPNHKNYSDYHFGKIIDEIEVQDGLLIQKHSGYYCFIHTSILYFFAASYLIKPNLDISGQKEDCPNNDKWKIVIEMAKDLLDYYKVELEHNSSRLFLSKTCLDITK